jgi:Tfp pilus assembly protein PilX
MHCSIRRRGAQSGAVMLVSLILLVLITLFVIAGLNFTNVQSRIAGNLQVRNELKTANQQAIEQVISVDFTKNTNIDPILFDVNGDSTPDYTVKVTPSCVSSVTIPIDDLDVTKTEDAVCTLTGAVQNSGIAIATPGNASLCANAIWDVKATGQDASAATFKTGASVVTHQGIGVRTVVGSGC